MRNRGPKMGSDLPGVSQGLLAEQRPEPLSAARSSVQASGTHSLATLQGLSFPNHSLLRPGGCSPCCTAGGERGAEKGMEMPLGWILQGEAQYSEGPQV